MLYPKDFHLPFSLFFQHAPAVLMQATCLNHFIPSEPHLQNTLVSNMVQEIKFGKINKIKL
jgi:hypothetical protein